MRKTFRRLLPLLAVLVVLCMALATPAFAAGDPTEEAGTKMIECSDCGAGGLCMTCYGHDEACEDCGGTFACASCDLSLPILSKLRLRLSFQLSPFSSYSSTSNSSLPTPQRGHT